MLRALAMALYRDERMAFWAAILMLLMPFQHLLMIALLPDSTLNVFWCGTLLASWYAMRDGKWLAWVVTGVLFGGALLSKYHAVLLPVCLLCYTVVSPSRRYWLGRIQPYVAGLIGISVFLPNVVWNAQHNWISYMFQLSRGGGHFSLGWLLATIGGQMGVWSPVIFGLLIAAFIVLARESPLSESDRFVFWTSVPVFVFFCGIGAFGKILPHWPSVGWWTGSLAVVSVVSRKVFSRDKAGARWRRWCLAAAITGLVMTGFVYAALLRPILSPLYIQARNISLRLHQHFPALRPLEPFRSRYDITNTLFGGEEVGEEVEAIRAEMPCPERTFVFCRHCYAASRLAVCLHPETATTTLRNRFNQYRFWFSAKDHTGWDALFVVDDGHFQEPERYLRLFREMDPEPIRIRVFRRGQLAQAWDVYRYYGFKGKFEGEQTEDSHTGVHPK